GSFTEKRVKEFQQYYGLKANGIADKKTQDKIKSVANSPFQNGKRHDDTPQLKRNLNKIGFGGITVTTLFSDFTEKRVREFQKEYGLVVNGIADEVTLAKIEIIANQSFQKGDRHKDITQMRTYLNKIGFNGLAIADLYGSFTEKRVKEFQQYYGLKANGIADKKTLDKIKSVANSPFQNGKRHDDTPQLKRNLNKIGFGGITVTTLFSDFTEKRVRENQKEYGLVVNGIADEVTLAKIETIANQSFQKGDRHKDITQMKRDLNKIGFDGLAIADLYGSFTEKRVKEFQQYYGLKVNG